MTYCANDYWSITYTNGYEKYNLDRKQVEVCHSNMNKWKTMIWIYPSNSSFFKQKKIFRVQLQSS